MSRDDLAEQEKDMYIEREELKQPSQYLGMEHENPSLVITTQLLAFYIKLGIEVLELPVVLQYSKNETAFVEFVNKLEKQRMEAAKTKDNAGRLKDKSAKLVQNNAFGFSIKVYIRLFNHSVRMTYTTQTQVFCIFPFTI